MIDANGLMQAATEFRDDITNDPGVAEFVYMLTGCIVDLNERITRIEKDLDAAGIPHDEKVKKAKRDLDMLGWKTYEGTQERS